MPPEWFAEGSGDEALELHEVVLKACEAQRENRYPNVEALQADLALLQSGQSLRRVRGLERRLSRLKTLGIAHEYEEFDDGHMGISYRFDVSLPKLAAALAP